MAAAVAPTELARPARRTGCRTSAGSPARAGTSSWRRSARSASSPSDPWRMRPVLVRVRYDDDGATETYQVPLVRRLEPADQVSHVLVGDDHRPGRRRPVLVATTRCTTRRSPARCWRASPRAATDGLLSFVPGPTPRTCRWTATSLVIERRAVQHVAGLRRRGDPQGVPPALPGPQPGPRDAPGAPRWAAPARRPAARARRGRWTLDGEPADRLAMLQEYFADRRPTAGRMAMTSVRDLMPRPTCTPTRSAAISPARRSGSARRPPPCTPTWPGRCGPTSLDAGELAAMAGQIERRLDAALAAVPSWRLRRRRCATRSDAAAGTSPAMPVQRIHGDCTSARCCAPRTAGWCSTSRASRPAARRAAGPDSPLRDVAGMLRSFDYAARHLLVEPRRSTPQHWPTGPTSGPTRNRDAFCDGYADAAAPTRATTPCLLRAFELDKAVYEAVYEARNRPRGCRSRWPRSPDSPEEHGRDVHASWPRTLTGRSREELDRLRRRRAPRPARGAAALHPASGQRPEPRRAGDDGHPGGRTRSTRSAAVARTVTAGARPAVRCEAGADPSQADSAASRSSARCGRTPSRVAAVSATRRLRRWRQRAPRRRVLRAACPGRPATTGSRCATGRGGRSTSVDDPYRWLPTLGEIDLHLIGEGRHERLWDVLGAHVRTYDTPRGPGHRHALRGLGAQRPRACGSPATSTAGRRWAHPMRSLGSTGVWELFVPGHRRRHPLQVPDPRRRTACGGRRPTRWRSAPRSRRRPRRS